MAIGDIANLAPIEGYRERRSYKKQPLLFRLIVYLSFMEINLCNRSAQQDKRVQIIKYKRISEPKSTFIAIHGEMTGEDKGRWDMYEIFKVQFIASCTTEEFGEVLVAFYYANEGSILCAQSLEYDLKQYDPEKNYSLIDYKSYLEICEFTGEKKLPFKEYIKTAIENSVVINSLLEDKGK